MHPSAAGHLLMGATLLRAWGAGATVTRVAIDAAAKTVAAAVNTAVSGLAAADGVLRWTQLDGALPLPVSFDDAEVALAEQAGADLASLDSQPLLVAGWLRGATSCGSTGSRSAPSTTPSSRRAWTSRAATRRSADRPSR